MLIEQIMTRNVIAVQCDTKLARMSDIMRENKLRHLPVVDEQRRLLGIVSHRDVQKAEPSPITTLDRGEVNYLLSKIRAQDLMHANVTTCSPSTRVEDAGLLMRDRRIGCLPVVDEERVIVGIITGIDMVDFFLDVTGCRVPGSHRVALLLKDGAGRLAQVLTVINECGGNIVAVMAPADRDAPGQRSVTIRYRASTPEQVEPALKAAGYQLIDS